MQGSITRKVSQISVASSGARKSTLTVINPIDSLKETKTTHEQTFKRKLSIENYFNVSTILGRQELGWLGFNGTFNTE